MTSPISGIRPRNNDIKPIVDIRKQQEGLSPVALKKENEKAEILLFGNNMQKAEGAKKATTYASPVKEQSAAVASALNNSDSIFKVNHNKNEKGFNFGIQSYNTGKTLASALKSPENNSSSSDKKEEQKTFLSAHKNLNDTRFEALDKDILSIYA